MRYTDPFLDALRLEGDPEPDRIVTELVRDGQVQEVNAVLKHLIQHNQPIPEELADNIEFWLWECVPTELRQVWGMDGPAAGAAVGRQKGEEQ